MPLAFFLVSSSTGSVRIRGELSDVRSTCKELAIFTADSTDGMLVAGFMKVFRAVFGVWSEGRGRTIGILQLVFRDDLLDPALHHAEVLLRVDVFGLTLCLHVLHFAYLSLVFLVAFEAVVDAGGGTWGFCE